MRLTSASVLLLPLFACAPHVDSAPESPLAHADPPADAVDPAPTTQDEAPDAHVSRLQFDADQATVDESLQRLAELDLLTVRDLLVDAPTGTGHCYGPCEDDPVDQAYMAEHARQTARLTAFVALATDVATSDLGEADEISDAMQALGSLELLDIIGPNTGNCYGPCPEDGEMAARINALADRSGDL